MTRREAESSSGIEGTHSTLDERLVVEETEVDHFATSDKPPYSLERIGWNLIG
ncbi:hypothetical protein [Azospirillum aestuarii]|uniref:hypothetical protein n=1 Tax=Azospirillum aestuarii TaxID=2802052 RepID=UPI001FFE9410|nr:hypothetical protein [Azospirillum aestuarii]